MKNAKKTHITEAEQEYILREKKWVIVQTFDCTNPVVIQGQSTQQETYDMMELMKCGWDEWTWDHITDCTVVELATAILRPIND